MNAFVSEFKSLPRCRCSLGPTSSRRRWISKSSNPYPYPHHPNPTPYQIFHLTGSASPEQVKARYYELVRLYHPDKADATTSSEEAHSRFQSIGQAYDILQGKKSPTLAPVEKAAQATTASRRAMHVRRHRALYEGGAVDDRWKDRFIIAGMVVTVALVGVQTFFTRRAAFQEAVERHDSNLYSRRRERVAEDSRLASPPPESSS